MNNSSEYSLYGLFGDPIDHSLSPFIHNSSFHEKNINSCYKKFVANKNNLEDVIKKIKTLNIKGGNITFPIKVDFMKYLDDIDILAEKIGAVNTFKNIDGRLIGYNTDGRGFISSLEENSIDYKNMNILLIGAGGAGNAIATSLIVNNIKNLYIKGRTPERPKKLKGKLRIISEDINIEIIENDENLREIIGKIDLIINSSNTGMNEDISPIKDDIIFNKDAVCYDIVYLPIKTRFLRNAEKMNLRTISGISMLIHQANLSFEIWTGKKFDIKKMEGEIEKLIK